jgi:hypothetical protein
MDYIRYLNESFDYTKEALWGRWVRWLLLLIASILFPFIYGYSVRVMSGTKPAPEPEGWIGLFIDGIKVIIISLVYTIPVYVLAAVSLLAYFVPVSSTTTPATGSAPGLGPEFGIVVVLALLVLFIVAIIVCGILATFGVARFARTGRMGDAFRIGTLRDHIGKVGWLDVFIALVVLTVVFAIVEFVLMFIPVIGWLLVFLLSPAFVIFASRYIALIYESAPAPA